MTADEESAAIARLVAADPRFREDAYRLLQDAMTLFRRNLPGERNASPDVALSAILATAVDQYGLLARTVVATFGLLDVADVAMMVHNACAIGIMVWGPAETAETFAAALSARDFGAELDACSLALFDVAPPRIVVGARSR